MNAYFPIDVTVLGISTEVKFEHPSNTDDPTLVTSSGQTNLVAFLTPELIFEDVMKQQSGKLLYA